MYTITYMYIWDVITQNESKCTYETLSRRMSRNVHMRRYHAVWVKMYIWDVITQNESKCTYETLSRRMSRNVHMRRYHAEWVEMYIWDVITQYKTLSRRMSRKSVITLLVSDEISEEAFIGDNSREQSCEDFIFQMFVKSTYSQFSFSMVMYSVQSDQ